MLRIEVDCGRIRRNAETIVETCARHSIQVVGVTKACCGHPDVARAMLSGGIELLGESRLSNIQRLRQAGIDSPIMLLRLPARSEIMDVVRLTQISLNSQVDTVRALSRAAQSLGVDHQVILMIEIGDRREGLMPDEALAAAREVSDLPCIELIGVGASVGCIGGVLPTHENAQQIVDVALQIERALGIRLPIVSGGQTTSLALLKRGEMPARVNQLRIGGAILLGVNSADPQSWPAPHQDAFQVVAEVIEVGTKPSLPEGPIRTDALGRIPHWEDHGPRRRAILAIGEQDLRVSGLRPKHQGVSVVGASSDHLVVDVTDADPPVHLGQEMAFDPNYGAVATGMAGFDAIRVIKPMNPLTS